MDRDEHDRQTREELIRASEIQPEGPPAPGDGERPWDAEADHGRDVLVAEHVEPAFAPRFCGDEAEESGDESLDRERVDDEH